MDAEEDRVSIVGVAGRGQEAFLAPFQKRVNERKYHGEKISLYDEELRERERERGRRGEER